jgi:DNA-binding transcriptional ArsR family regulator
MCIMMHMSVPADDAPFDHAPTCLHPAAVRAARHRVAAAPPAPDIAALFAILGDATRLRILLALGSAELCVCDLAAATGINRSTVSHQLRVLRDSDLVHRRRDGKVIYYTLADEHVVALLQMGSAHAGHSMSDAVEIA